jgi:hypothetical protein
MNSLHKQYDMIHLNQLIKKLTPCFYGLATTALIFFSAGDIDRSQASERFNTVEGIGFFFLIGSLSIGALIIARHISAIKPRVNYAAPKSEEKIDAARKERNTGKATQKVKEYIDAARKDRNTGKALQKVKEYKELRDAGLLSESEYQTKIKKLKKLIN